MVICPQPSRPTCDDYLHYKTSTVPIVTVENEIIVVRLPSYASPISCLVSRIYESLSFGRHACKYLAKTIQKPDVMYVNAWPMLAQAMIIKFAVKNKIPVLLQIMDIYPESMLSKLPAILRGVVYPPLLKLDKWIAKQAQTVVISDNMMRAYTETRRISKDRIVTINTWQDDKLFEIVHDRDDACHRYSIPSSMFTFLYLGNIGPVAGVDFLLSAFHQASIAGAQLVIVGDGSAKADCVKLVDNLNIEHIHFNQTRQSANVAL